MTLTWRVALPFLLVLVVVLVLGQWSLQTTRELQAVNVRLLTRAIPAARTEVVLANLVPTLVRHDRHARVLGDATSQGLHRRAAQIFRDQLADLTPVLDEVETRRAISGVERQFTRYVATTEAAWDRGGRSAATGRADPGPGDDAEPLVRAVETLGGHLDHAVAAEVAAAGHLEHRARTMASGAFLASVALGVGFAALVTLRIERPLRALHRAATEAMAEGQFRVPLLVTTRDEVGRLAGALAAMAHRHHQVESGRATLLANISHDLRSPLHSIGTATALLETAPLDARQARWLQIIEADSRKILRLTNQILDVANARDGMLALRLAPADLCVIVQDAADELRPDLDAHGLQFTLDVPESALPLVCDAGRVQQVLVNLLSNAVKFTPTGGRVAVTATDHGQSVMVSVTDSGVGIPAADLSRLFTRYQRVQRETEGTGLGLAIVKEFVEAHGGRVAIQSREGAGTRLDVKLPKAGPPT